MQIQENIINKVAQSGLVSFDLAELYPTGERVIYDIKDNLFHGLILREKDFREFVKEHNWEQYQDKHVAVTCTADAIVPTWAYMLLANKLTPFAKTVVFGDLETLETLLFEKELARLDVERFRDQRIVVKGCGDIDVPVSAFVELTNRLTKVAKSIMYGEPCSTVPVYKRKD
jgi:protease II